MYILDEPSIGLHQRDNQRLLDTLVNLRDLGNTVIVVEHDEDAIRQADYVVDLGPGAGVHGGRSSPRARRGIAAHPDSITGQYLSGRGASRSRAAPRARSEAAAARLGRDRQQSEERHRRVPARGS
jgi:excinuclease ABC subunit A